MYKVHTPICFIFSHKICELIHNICWFLSPSTGSVKTFCFNQWSSYPQWLNSILSVPLVTSIKITVYYLLPAIRSRNFYFNFPLESFIKNLLFLPAQHTVKELLFYLPSRELYKVFIISSSTTYGQGMFLFFSPLSDSL